MGWILSTSFWMCVKDTGCATGLSKADSDSKNGTLSSIWNTFQIIDILYLKTNVKMKEFKLPKIYTEINWRANRHNKFVRNYPIMCARALTLIYLNVIAAHRTPVLGVGLIKNRKQPTSSNSYNSRLPRVPLLNETYITQTYILFTYKNTNKSVWDDSAHFIIQEWKREY